MLMIRVLLFAVSLSSNLATISRPETSECARISDRASARAHWAAIRGWMLLIGAALCIALVATLSGPAHAGVALWIAAPLSLIYWMAAVRHQRDLIPPGSCGQTARVCANRRADDVQRPDGTATAFRLYPDGGHRPSPD